MNLKMVGGMLGIVVLLASLIAIYKSGDLNRKYKKLEEISDDQLREEALVLDGASVSNKEDLITEEDLIVLPKPVREYLRYVGVVGKPMIQDYKAVISGHLKMNRASEYSSVEVNQHSYINNIARYFYITMNYKGLPVQGLHYYHDYNAVMDIRVLGLMQVGLAEGEKMNQGETVTVFNDICVMAPGALIDKRITWETVDDYTVIGHFTNGSIKVSAKLFFNEAYQLINFVSEDRYMSETGASYELVTWSTPIEAYSDINGYNLPSKAKAIWHTESGPFEYADFDIQDVIYNTVEIE